MNLQNLRRLGMILINYLRMVLINNLMLGRLLLLLLWMLMDDLRRRGVVLLVDDLVVLQLRGRVGFGDQGVMSIAHRVIGAVFSRVVWWIVVIGVVSVGRVTVLATLEASIQRAVRQVEVNRCLVDRHLTDTKKVDRRKSALWMTGGSSFYSPDGVKCLHHCVFGPGSGIWSWQLDSLAFATTVKRS